MTGELRDPSLHPSDKASGTFFFSLSESTLTYSISTRLQPLAEFDLSAADYKLESGSGEILLPIIEHKINGFSGCSLTFVAFSPYSSQLPDSDLVFFPFGIDNPGLCDGHFLFSVLSGSVEISPSNLPLFDQPDFMVSLGSLGIVGQTDPEVVRIPEPHTLCLGSFIALSIFRRRRNRPRLTSGS